MKKSLLIVIALLFVTLTGWTMTPPPITRYVPCGGPTPCYSTIQAAVNASTTGDVINVAAGTYAEYITINNGYPYFVQYRNNISIIAVGSVTINGINSILTK